ncbi:MAG: hypothetical protein WC906_00680 [Parcubacteria group bacterium]|jgi:hypothetical protein
MKKGKKDPVLTEIFCKKTETLRLGIELASGQRVKFNRLDLNTGKGQVFVGDEVKDVAFHFCDDHYYPAIHLYMNNNCLTILYDNSPIVHFINEKNPVRKHGQPQITSGTSLNDQWLQDNISFTRKRPHTKE